MNLNLIKIHLRTSIGIIIGILSLYTLTFMMIERTRITIFGSILLLIFMINSYGLITKVDTGILNLIPIENKEKVKSYIGGVLILVLGMTGMDYLYNILVVGNGPYNLIYSVKTIIVFLNVVVVLLFLLNFLKIVEILIEKIFKKRIEVYKGLASLYIVFLIMIKLEINIFANVDVIKILEVLNYKANNIFSKNHILKSSDFRFIDVKNYRPEKIEAILSKMFYIEREVIFMNADKLLINLIFISILGYINYRIFIKIMER